MKPKFIVQFSTNGKRYFYLNAANNEVILTSELYNSKQAVINGILSVMENAANPANFENRLSKPGIHDPEPYFVLNAANGEIIGTSEMYTTRQAADTGIAAVMQAAPAAHIIDRT